MEYEKLRQEVVNLQSYLERFKVEFLDREDFKKFADNLWSNINGWNEVCITGYFSEAVREDLTRYLNYKEHKLRLISQELDPQSKRDRKNLEVLRKLSSTGAEIKLNNRLHARFLVAHTPTFKGYGLLVLGSFDFNTECMGKERYDAGIKTTHPDLVQSTLNLFEQIWNEPESLLLDNFIGKLKK
jgi:hypothetical protein